MLNGELYVAMQVDAKGGMAFAVTRWPTQECVSRHATIEEAEQMVALGNEELYAKKQQRIEEAVNQIDKFFSRG